MHEIQGTTRLLGIIGDPIKHSRSPIMQNAALSHLGADYVYVPFPVKQEQLGVVLEGFQAVGVVGFNVTIPHKQAIMPYLSQISPLAQAMGAVNTVWRTERGWEGTNTDVLGFIAPLKEERQKWSESQVVILGNGGSARAVVAGCLELGVKQVHVVGRNLERLQAFQQSWSSPVIVHLWHELPDLLSETTLLVNTTPIGMSPNVNATPVEQELLAQLPKGAILYDLIYNPRPTQFLKLGRSLDLLTIDGTEMLIQQGAAALQIWLDEPVPVGVMRRALLDAL
jgi:shikimate dehydrogenase